MGEKIAMFKTKPYVSEKVWGYERWIVSTHEVGQATVDSCTEFIGGKNLSKIVGDKYPLLIKIIQANETLSVQVHPDDEYARQHEDSNGKTEGWYVLDAIDGASLITGLNKEYSSEQILLAIKENRIESCLRSVTVEKGDFIFIPAGTVHAIQGGLRLLEIQQSSDITYRLYDWGREREVHIDKGVSVIKNTKNELERPFSGKFSCSYFSLEKQDIRGKGTIQFTVDEDNITPAQKTQWVSLFILEGEGTLSSNTGEKLSVSKEDSIMVNLDEKIQGEGNFSVMKIF